MTLKHPLVTEKAMNEMDFDNKLQFICHSEATKSDIAEAVERQFDDDVELPLVVADAFENLQKTQAVVDALEALGVHADVERADETKIKAGQGSTRGRKYRRPKSILFVTSEEPSRAARNLAGADVATAREVNAEDLAPGTEPGRLTVWTESAVEEVADR